MAEEILFKYEIAHYPSNINVRPANFEPKVIKITQSGTKHQSEAATIGTSEETLAISSDIGTEGILVIQNLDDTNYVQVGFSTGVYGIRIKAGEEWPFRLEPGVTVYIIANTASVNVQFTIYED